MCHLVLISMMHDVTLLMLFDDLQPSTVVFFFSNIFCSDLDSNINPKGIVDTENIQD